MTTPVVLNCRDRVSDLRVMVDWLERAGAERIVLLDNDSTYPPLLEYLAATPHEVRRGPNHGHLAIYLHPDLIDGPYFYGDPDTPFLAPLDGLQRLRDVAERHGDRDKVGFGLTLDGVPETMMSISWERELWDANREIEPGVFDAPVDTTFAFYNRPTTDIWRSLRLGPPYVMRHSPWYADPLNLSAEDRYYVERASRSSSWAEELRR